MVTFSISRTACSKFRHSEPYDVWTVVSPRTTCVMNTSRARRWADDNHFAALPDVVDSHLDARVVTGRVEADAIPECLAAVVEELVDGDVLRVRTVPVHARDGEFLAGVRLPVPALEALAAAVNQFLDDVVADLYDGIGILVAQDARGWNSLVAVVGVRMRVAATEACAPRLALSLSSGVGVSRCCTSTSLVPVWTIVLMSVAPCGPFAWSSLDIHKWLEG